MGANERSDDAATVNVTDQYHGAVHGFGKAHIGNVTCPQIDFCGAACTLDKDKIGAFFQALEACANRSQEVRLHRLIGSGFGMALCFTLHNHLAAQIGLGL